MFSTLAQVVDRAWFLLLAGWVALMLGLRLAAPAWSDVAKDGQFSFLPENAPSRRGDELFNKAFPNDLLSSSVVLVVSRENGQGLTDDDREFVSRILRPRLREIMDSDEYMVHGRPAIARIRAFDDELVGPLMMSDDRQATLVLIELTNDFFSRDNSPTIRAIEELIANLEQSAAVPHELAVELTGSAVVGRDITRANERSAAAIGRWTIILVIGLTLVVFRAPLLALIPLVTLFVAMEVALKSLALLAEAGGIGLFKGIEAYTTVVVYASGVDYSLFLISRFKEALDTGKDRRQALHEAIGKVGGAITASAATEIVGIGTMTVASFQKFHEAGIAISFSLAVMLLSVLTLTPALLRLTGPLAFWPHQSVAAAVTTAPPSTRGGIRFERVWERIACAVLRRPATFWLTTTSAMIPFAVIGAWHYNQLNYDLVGNLPRLATSIAGTKTLQRHFPAGTAGPVNLLVRNSKIDFQSSDGIVAIETLTDRIVENRDELQIADVRSIAAPLGALAADKSPVTGDFGRRLLTAGVIRRRAMSYFVSATPELRGQVTRLELELQLDPFAEVAMDFLNDIESRVRDCLPEALQIDSEIYFSGSTASLRDLKAVGARDRTLINILAVASIFAILVILLHRFWLTLYLMLTVLLSYLVTVGATYLVFFLADRQGFPGLDWTVPLFLFTVLIAIGEDYNILLTTRIHEEQARYGIEQGVAVALARTGPIISSCGFIMAGTFLSLAIAGQLAQMIQLGFALAFGVLLDTFIVRPILVPTYFLLGDRGRRRAARMPQGAPPAAQGPHFADRHAD